MTFSGFMRGIQALLKEADATVEDVFGSSLNTWAALMPPLLPAPPFKLRQGGGNMILNCSEVGMGGPEACQYMLADGAIIDNVSSGWNTSADQRYAAAFTDARNSASFVVYDRQEHICYHYDKDDARDIFDRLFSATIDAHSIRTGRRVSTTLPRVLNESRAVPYAPYRGLWLDPYLARQAPKEVLTYEGNGPPLTAVLYAPPDLRTLENPLAPVTHFRWQLHLDGEPSACWSLNLDAPLVSAEGDAFILPGEALDETMQFICSVWHVWTRERGWMSIDADIRDQRGVRVGELCTPVRISATAVVFKPLKKSRTLTNGWTRATTSEAAIPVKITSSEQGVLAEVALDPGSTG